ncbi:MAG: ATP-dependent RecD-like DNA helicase [Clostridia bacterium]|nr:ATP-dependent RecD-like DNA helicase [Clostridia bacterium]
MDKDAYQGMVDEIIYENEDNGYAIFDLDAGEDGLITCVGTLPFIKRGEMLIVCGKWVNHPSYGEQLKIEYFERIEPQTKDTILTYLASGVVKGIGKATAEKIVDRFGEEALQVIVDTPERLAEIKGITHEKAMKISENYMAIYEKENLILFLQKYNISPSYAIRVYDLFGKRSVEMIKDNPYILCERIRGISFRTADAVAAMSGGAKNSMHRIKSGMKYILTHFAGSEGHTYLKRNILINQTVQMLGVDELEAENALVKLLTEHQLVNIKIDEHDAIFLPPLYHAEFLIALCIRELMEDTKRAQIKDAEAEIKKLEKETGITLAEKQKEAVLSALSGGVTVITGGPGTGKTTTINFIIRLFERAKQKIALAAPTGRAAKRMTELCGRDAKTIHRLLEVGYSEDDILREYSRENEEPLEEDVIIVDEVSMVDAILMSSLLNAVKNGGRVILVGDSDQLPSVGAGNVLADIIASEKVPVVCLNTVFRQAEESMIVVNAHRINTGEYPILNRKGKDFFFVEAEDTGKIAALLPDLVTRRLPEAYRLDPMTDIQVITPMKKTQVGVFSLNAMLQSLLNPPEKGKNQKEFQNRILREGDKVMQVKNNYDLRWTKEDGDEGYGVYNGDMGRILSVKNTTVEILYDDGKLVRYESAQLEEIDHAYAITVHKSQGSEFKTVVIPVFRGTEKLFTRNLLYTAVTRAKEMVVLVGQRSALKMMVDNDYEAKRFSGLAHLLEQE